MEISGLGIQLGKGVNNMKRNTWDCDLCKAKDVSKVTTIIKNAKEIHLCESCSTQHLPDDVTNLFRLRTRETF